MSHEETPPAPTTSPENVGFDWEEEEKNSLLQECELFDWDSFGTDSASAKNAQVNIDAECPALTSERTGYASKLPKKGFLEPILEVVEFMKEDVDIAATALIDGVLGADGGSASTYNSDELQFPSNSTSPESAAPVFLDIDENNATVAFTDHPLDQMVGKPALSSAGDVDTLPYTIPTIISNVANFSNDQGPLQATPDTQLVDDLPPLLAVEWADGTERILKLDRIIGMECPIKGCFLEFHSTTVTRHMSKQHRLEKCAKSQCFLFFKYQADKLRHENIENKSKLMCNGCKEYFEGAAELAKHAQECLELRMDVDVFVESP